MEGWLLALALGAGVQWARRREQQARIERLGRHLQGNPLERLMAHVLDGYLRALDEGDTQRRQTLWAALEATERELAAAARRLAVSFADVWPDDALVSTLPVALPYAHKLFPRATFDMRRALQLHADGIAAVVDNASGRSRRDRAYTLTAEALLLQHTCHWYCRSRAVASARLLARHRTSYAQVLDAVSPQTRSAYLALLGR
ncbi:hypothetical protein [Tepidimonas charontis]|uniref:Uncharacterized protein n=1 Tax=Tepidimonas charontis TaxID=2267262 RepID=A0A554XJV4_9BURK|nr:hypothetical protein [Tepidimonas charontis]TSE36117.1 hypothetical protein Tchar_00163 [Tepidimonas charontis]